MIKITLSLKGLALFRARAILAEVLVLSGLVALGANFVVFLTVLTATIIVAVFFCVFYFPKYIKSFKIQIFSQYISVEYGVFIKTEKIMPLFNIVSVNTIKTPLSSVFSLRAVAICALKNRIYIPSLSKTSIETLKKGLKVE